MGTGSPLQRRHGSAKAPTRSRGLAAFRGAFWSGRAGPAGQERPQKRETPRQPLRPLRASTPRFWSSRLAGYVVGLGPEVVSKALWKELSAYRRRASIQGSSTLFREASPRCLPDSVCRNPGARSQSGIRAGSREGLRQAEAGLWQPRPVYSGVCGKNFAFAARAVLARSRQGTQRQNCAPNIVSASGSVAHGIPTRWQMPGIVRCQRVVGTPLNVRPS